jgi:hypothetical protein
MKIPLKDFTLKNVQKIKQNNKWNDHFNFILWPRILVWLGLMEQFNDIKSVQWKIHYSPNNMNNNMISIHIQDPNKVFNFHFQIPLIQKLNFNLFLGDSTYNFFEAHPLLLSNGIMKPNEFPIKATSNILPHLLLSTPVNKYNPKTLQVINENNYLQLTKHDALINMLTYHFKKFIPALENIIKGVWCL